MQQRYALAWSCVHPHIVWVRDDETRGAFYYAAFLGSSIRFAGCFLLEEVAAFRAFFGCLALHGCSPSTALLLGIFDTGLRGRNVYWEHEDAHEEMDSGCLAVLLLYRARNNHTTIM